MNIITKKGSLTKFLDDWVIFSFSSKLKFAIKVALSIALAFLISFYMGWSQVSTAGITIMLIVSAGGVSDSILLGAVRAIGTVIGAAIGLFLLALFPQERFIYLLCMSLMIFILVYLYHSYQGDSTVFMLIIMMIMKVFKGGEIDDSFLFGVDKTYMTLFGIAVYAMVGVFLWPSKKENRVKQDAAGVVEAQLKYFMNLHSEDANALLKNALEIEKKFQNSYSKIKEGSFEMTFDGKIWESINYNYKILNDNFTLLAMHLRDKDELEYRKYILNYDELISNINTMLEAQLGFWKENKSIKITSKLDIQYDENSLQEISHLKKANVISVVKSLFDIHNTLMKIVDRLNSINGEKSQISFENEVLKQPKFIWFNPESFKGAFQTFCIFWFACGFWIYLNPPGGFMLVFLATMLSILTSNSPLKPSILTMLFTIGFIFSTVAYIFVLPNLTYGWELALFIFFYVFIAFYVINPKITIFFLLGMFLLSIENTMHYSFAVYINILLMFYIFLFILLIFYYIPFSTKPEILFVTMKYRFFKHAKGLIKVSSNKKLFFSKTRESYHIKHMELTLAKMKLWATKIDANYFDKNKLGDLMAFAGECEALSNKLTLLAKDKKTTKNRLTEKLMAFENANTFLKIINNWEDSSTHKNNNIDSVKNIFEKIEMRLEEFKSSLKLDIYTREEVLEFYVSLGLYQSTWQTAIKCNDTLTNIDWQNLQMKKF